MALSSFIKWALYRDAGLQWLDPTHASLCPVAFGSTLPASTAYQASNLMFAYAFSLASPKTLSKILVPIGATSSGHVDVGILDSTGARLTSAGATAMGTANNVQTVDVADVSLSPGTLYYAAIAVDNTTATLLSTLGLLGVNANAFGIRQTAASYPIPASPVLTTTTSAQTYPLVILEFAS